MDLGRGHARTPCRWHLRGRLQRTVIPITVEELIREGREVLASAWDALIYSPGRAPECLRSRGKVRRVGLAHYQ